MNSAFIGLSMMTFRIPLASEIHRFNTQTYPKGSTVCTKNKQCINQIYFRPNYWTVFHIVFDIKMEILQYFNILPNDLDLTLFSKLPSRGFFRDSKTCCKILAIVHSFRQNRCSCRVSLHPLLCVKTQAVLRPLSRTVHLLSRYCFSALCKLTAVLALLKPLKRPVPWRNLSLNW